MQTSHGDTAQLARYSIVSRVGTFLGPVIVGAAWDLFGAWAAVACVALCGAGIVASAAHGAQEAEPLTSSVTSVLVPDWERHRNALLLAANPAAAFVLAVSFLRNAPGAIQSSLYVVYLNGIGMSGTLIGQFLVLLVAASAVRGMAQGLSQPLMYSILSHAVPGTRHGAGVGLRNAVVRLASIVTPTVMGFVAEGWGIETSFYVIGAVFLLATAALALSLTSNMD